MDVNADVGVKKTYILRKIEILLKVQSQLSGSKNLIRCNYLNGVFESEKVSS